MGAPLLGLAKSIYLCVLGRLRFNYSSNGRDPQLWTASRRSVRRLSFSPGRKIKETSAKQSYGLL